jgi:hypothetical protein
VRDTKDFSAISNQANNSSNARFIESREIILDDILPGLSITMSVESPILVSALTAFVTALFNDYDEIAFNPRMASQTFILFTDKPLKAPKIYNIIKVNFSKELTGVLKNRIIKFLTHRLIPEYETVVYFDANFIPSNKLINNLEWKSDQTEGMLMFRHPERSSVSEEISECIKRGKLLPMHKNLILKAYAYYFTTGIDNRLYQNRFFCRSNNCNRIAAFADELVKAILTLAPRDQTLVPILLKKHSIEPSTYKCSAVVYGRVVPHRGEGKLMSLRYTISFMLAKLVLELKKIKN